MRDNISRRAALDACAVSYYASSAYKRIESLPSTDPKEVYCPMASRTCFTNGKEVAWCLTCPHISEEDRELVKKAVEGSQPKTGHMSDNISRQAEPEKRTEKRTETHACDCISRQAAIDALKLFGAEHNSIAVIKGLPSTDRMGHWKIYNHVDHMGRPTGTKICVCDQCEETMSLPWRAKIPNYCQNCGADMRGEQDAD